MSAPPLFSVIIPCYNQGRFLGESIESVLDQTVQDFEIVVIDDGSTDQTNEVAGRYHRAHYIGQTNQGLSAARNTGIRESRGRYLVFLDADDKLLPNALEAALVCFRANPEYAFVSGGFRRISANGAFIERQPTVKSEHYLVLLKYNYIGMQATVAYRREAIEAVGGFDIRLPACEDYDLYLRIASQFPVATHEEIVADYRIHDTNMSHDPSFMLFWALRVLRAQKQHLGNDTRALAAYKQGLNYWPRYYGRTVIRKLSPKSESGKLYQRAGTLARLFMLAPLPLLSGGAKLVARSILPAAARRRLKAHLSNTPAVKSVKFGDLRRLTPISRTFGYDRGKPIDRFYIENFLLQQSTDIRGRVLEIGDNAYTRCFGGDRVTCSDVLHLKEGNPQATFVGDLTKADHIPSDAFDCVILTQTLHLIYDLRSAIATLKRILSSGGVLLLTAPGTISQIEHGTWASVWHWGFTELLLRKLFQEAFQPEQVSVQAHGNVLSAIAFLEGIAAEELSPRELSFRDVLYPLLLTVRARKSTEPSTLL